MSRIAVFPARKSRGALLFLFALVAFFALLRLGLGFLFGAFFAFHFLLALLDDFRLGRRCSFRSHGFRGLLFFDLERDDVRQHAFGLGQQLEFRGVNRQITGAQR